MQKVGDALAIVIHVIYVLNSGLGQFLSVGPHRNLETNSFRFLLQCVNYSARLSVIRFDWKAETPPTTQLRFKGKPTVTTGSSRHVLMT